MKFLRLAQKLNAQHISLEWCRNMCNYVNADEIFICLAIINKRGEKDELLLSRGYLGMDQKAVRRQIIY